MTTERYRGWDLDYDAARPAGLFWRATRGGIAVCAQRREQLIRIIDHHEEDRGEWIARRRQGWGGYTNV